MKNDAMLNNIQEKIFKFQKESHEKLREVSNHILHLAEKGTLLGDFLNMVSDILLMFSHTDCVSIIVHEIENYYRFSKQKGNSGQYEFSQDTQFGKLNLDTDHCTISSLEQSIFFNLIENHGNNTSESGGIWITDAKQKTVFQIRRNGIPHTFLFNPGTNTRSILILPITFNNIQIGLITLTAKKANLFMESDIALYQSLYETIALGLRHRKAQVHLRERIKELTCIYKIAKIGAETELSIPETMKLITEIIPAAFVYPEITSCRIVISDMEYYSPNFKEPVSKRSVLHSSIQRRGKKHGFIEVAYSEERIFLYEGPFVKEEIKMLETISREISLILERKEAEDEKRRLQSQLFHADRLITIGQLAAGVAHELNEPLGSILGFSQLLKKNDKHIGDHSKDLEKIINASLYARDIVKKLLIFSRQMAPDKTKVQINDHIEDSVYLLESRLRENNVELVLDLCSSLPLIILDISQVNQAIINLAINAIQAMPDGGTLTISSTFENRNILISVEDTGIGIAKENLDKIFIPFFTTKEVNEGTGLGLSVVSGIVESHGGTISVYSEIGSGSRFEISLPVKKE